MEFEWDKTKSDACFAQRGFDFAYAVQAFIDPDRLIRHDHRWNYDEDRFQLVGMIEQRVFYVVYSVRNSVIRIISARKANQREVKGYENSTRQG